MDRNILIHNYAKEASVAKNQTPLQARQNGFSNFSTLSQDKKTEDLLRHFGLRESLCLSEITFLQRTAFLVEANLADATFSADEFARQMLLSRTHLYRKLKGLTGLSTSKFVTSLRLKKAALLLRQDGEPVSQIAYAVGFNHLSYFAKCFKEQYAYAPSEYRRRNSVTNSNICVK